MDATLLKSFLAILEHRSITAASSRLGIAQPSLSQQLLRLEDELGVKLFGRTGRGVVPTESAFVFEEHARTILAEVERAQAGLRDLERSPTGDVGVGLPQSASVLLGVPLILAVEKQLPNVTLTVSEAMSGHIQEWIDAGVVDLGILYDATRLRRFVVTPLLTEELCLVGPAGEFAPRGRRGLADEPLRLSDVSPLNLILPSRRHGLRRFLDASLGVNTVGANLRTEVDSLAHIKSLVAAGHGRSILSQSAIGEELANGTLSAVVLVEPALQRSVDLVRNPARLVTRASAAVEMVMVRLIEAFVRDGLWVTKD